MSAVPLKTCDHPWCSNEFPEHYLFGTCADFHLPAKAPRLRRLLWKLPRSVREIVRAMLNRIPPGRIRDAARS